MISLTRAWPPLNDWNNDEPMSVCCEMTNGAKVRLELCYQVLDLRGQGRGALVPGSSRKISFRCGRSSHALPI